MQEAMRAAVRPLVTLSLVGTTIVLSLLVGTGEATLQDAQDAFTFIGPMTGVAMTFWFMGRPGEKAAESTPIEQPDPRGD
jgi:hypothetical protein